MDSKYTPVKNALANNWNHLHKTRTALINYTFGILISLVMFGWLAYITSVSLYVVALGCLALSLIYRSLLSQILRLIIQGQEQNSEIKNMIHELELQDIRTRLQLARIRGQGVHY